LIKRVSKGFELKKNTYFLFFILLSINSWGYSLVERGVAIGYSFASKRKPGIVYHNINSYGSQPRGDNKPSMNTISEIPIFIVRSKQKYLGGQLILHLVPPTLIFDKGSGDPFKRESVNAKWHGGTYNPFGAAGIAWDLPLGWGFSNSVGWFVPWDGSNFAYHGWSFIDAIAFGHFKEREHNLTGILFIGIPGEDSKFHHKGDNNFINFNLTATRTFKEKYEIGGLLYYTSDFGPQVLPVIPKQTQLAVGGLVGYHADNWFVQAWYGHDVSQENYPSFHSIGFIRIGVDLAYF
jgi:hypothetical protein